jgi:hypothetical protein
VLPRRLMCAVREPGGASLTKFGSNIKPLL